MYSFRTSELSLGYVKPNISQSMKNLKPPSLMYTRYLLGIRDTIVERLEDELVSLNSSIPNYRWDVRRVVSHQTQFFSYQQLPKVGRRANSYLCWCIRMDFFSNTPAVWLLSSKLYHHL